MQEERKDEVEETEEVEAHRFRAGAEDPQRLADAEQRNSDEDEVEVEAHRWRYGSEEPGKRF
jgi:hypothetical protein